MKTMEERRTISCEAIADTVARLCIQANTLLPSQVRGLLC